MDVTVYAIDDSMTPHKVWPVVINTIKVDYARPQNSHGENPKGWDDPITRVYMSHGWMDILVPFTIWSQTMGGIDLGEHGRETYDSYMERMAEESGNE